LKEVAEQYRKMNASYTRIIARDTPDRTPLIGPAWQALPA
jgi:hypothetical protein